MTPPTSATPELLPLTDMIERIVARYLSLREAARALSMDHGYLSKLMNGTKRNPSKQTMRKLGIYQVTLYGRIKS